MSGPSSLQWLGLHLSDNGFRILVSLFLDTHWNTSSKKGSPSLSPLSLLYRKQSILNKTSLEYQNQYLNLLSYISLACLHCIACIAFPALHCIHCIACVALLALPLPVLLLSPPSPHCVTSVPHSSLKNVHRQERKDHSVRGFHWDSCCNMRKQESISCLI